MENKPEFRIVGGAPEEKKEQAKKELESALFDHFASLSPKEREKLEKLEYPKSETELALIDFANAETNRLGQELGLEPYDIPKENYHIVPPEFYKEAAGESSSARTFFTKQGVLFNAEECHSDTVFFGSTALHETLHLKGHITLEVEEKDGKTEETSFRKGVTVEAAQKLGLHRRYHRHFEGLHEAIVSAQEKKTFLKILELPVLDKERKWLMSDEARELKERIKKEKGVPIDEIMSARWIKKEENKYEWADFSYISQRQALEYACQEIQKEFPEQYKTPDDVFNEFLKAHFTGRLLTIARLAEKTFGKGGFRLLGNMEENKQSGVLHLEALRKKRIQALKNKS